MKIRRNFVILLFISFLLLEYGCQKSAPYDLSYREKSFCAQIEGNQFGAVFCCDIYCEDGKVLKIIYSSPPALQNITVLTLRDGSFQVEKDGICQTFSDNSTQSWGLLLPAHRLLLNGFSRSSVDSVQRLAQGTLLTLSLPNEEHPISVSLDTEGFPTVISGKDFSYQIRLR